MADKLADELPSWLADWDKGEGASYSRLAHTIAEAVLTGNLRPGERLPPQRQLAWRLGLNLSTVTKAFTKLETQGIIAGEIGRGTFILPRRTQSDLFRRTEESKRVIDLSLSVPARVGKPISSYHFVSTASDYLDTYHPSDLLDRTRHAIRIWLTYRGAEIRTEDIIPCTGAHAALIAALQTLPSRNQPLLVENFTFPGIKAIACTLGFRLVGIDCDSEGLLPEKLDALAARGCSALVCVPNLQNPTGTIMSGKRRQEIADIINRRNILLIEDDIYGPLSGQAPLATMIRNPSIIISSLSKIIAPGLRFGFLCYTSEGLSRHLISVHNTSWLASPFCTHIGSELIENGLAQDYAALQREEIRTRLTSLRRSFPISTHTNSPHLWLPVTGDSDCVARRCLTRGVSVASSSSFRVRRSDTHDQFIRICLTKEKRERVEEAVSRISEFILW